MIASKIVVLILPWSERTSAGAALKRFRTSSGAWAMMVLVRMLPVTFSLEACSYPAMNSSRAMRTSVKFCSLARSCHHVGVRIICSMTPCCM